MAKYIHEREDWWSFRYDADRLQLKLAHVNTKMGLLMGKLSLLGFDVQARAYLDSLSDNVTKSSEIEGEKLNYSQVRSSIARRLNLSFPGMESSSRHIDGIVEMMLDATRRCHDPLTESRLLGWHNVLFPTGFSGPYKIDVAKYRDNRMQVVSGAMGKEKIHYEAPAPERVPSEMRRLIEWVNTEHQDIDPIIKAAIAHLWFITIHPFDDGNGRIARAITDMLLARADGCQQRFYSMSGAICSHRQQYYDILEAVQHGDGNITEWLSWFLDILDSALDYTGLQLQSAIEKDDFWKRYSDHDINPRQKKILNMMLDGFEGNMTTGRWSRICHCSRDTALRDATALLKMGILVQSEKGGRSTSYQLAPPPSGK